MSQQPIGPHEPDPHHESTGDWTCYACKTPLAGSFMRPAVPWRHKDDATAFAVLVKA